MRNSLVVLLSLTLTSAALHAQTPVPAATSKPALADKWIYLSTNLLVDKNVDNAVALLERAAKAGYNGVLLTDSKFAILDTMGDKYFKNAARVRQTCRDNKLKCVVAVCSIGYSEGLLAHDPNLAEGIPVNDATFVVRNGKLIPADEGPQIANGSFEQSKGNAPTGWLFVDQPGKITFIDTDVKFAGAASLRMQDIGTSDPKNGHGRICQILKLKPFRYYHVSAMVKTDKFESAGQFEIKVLAKDGTSLNYQTPHVAQTQDWKRVDICFNSLEFAEANLYLGVWGGKGGKIWLDDVLIEPAGFMNVVRRDGAPLKVTSEDGKTVYTEGKDFASIADKLMGMDPYRGNFTVWHKTPEVAIPEGSRLKDGQKVLASYYHTAIIYGDQVMVCLNEPKVYDILQSQIALVHKHLAPDGYFMSHDEIRVQGWDVSCQKSGHTPGESLAENVRRCIAMIRKEDAGKPIYVWSDMFDPNHNAKKTGRYYLVKGDGPWYESWKGLDREIIIANWNQNKPDTLKFFADLGNKQILAGYYDADPGRITEWLRQAAAVGGATGVIYTTWENKYDDLEKFIEATKK